MPHRQVDVRADRELASRVDLDAVFSLDPYTRHVDTVFERLHALATAREELAAYHARDAWLEATIRRVGDARDLQGQRPGRQLDANSPAAQRWQQHLTAKHDKALAKVEPADAEVHYLAHTLEEWRYYWPLLASSAFRLSFTVTLPVGASPGWEPPPRPDAAQAPIAVLV